MAKWLDKLVERLRREKTTATQPIESVPEPEWVVYGYEPIAREGVYRFCYQLDFTRRMSPGFSLGTARYVALLEAATDGSLGIEVEHHFCPDYRRTGNSHIFSRPLSVLTPYDVFEVFWKHLERQPCFPDFPDSALKVFPADTLPVLYHEGGLELLTIERAPKKQ